MKRKKISEAYLRLKALNDISQEFAEAMCMADPRFITRTLGAHTPHMDNIWFRYVSLMKSYGENA